MEDSGIPNNLKLPPIRRPKDLPKKVKLHGSVAAGVSATSLPYVLSAHIVIHNFDPNSNAPVLNVLLVFDSHLG